jgi:tRNA threonylcarbamoyladenosine biosynthesis protein TsaE
LAVAELGWVSHSAEETVRRGRELGARLRPPLLVKLTGELGAGKTTLAKGLVAGLGAGREEDVTSPTFTLVHVFHNHCKVYHVDLYRISDFHDLETLGLEDVLAEPAVVLVEWAEKFSLRTDWPVIEIRLEHLDEESRRIRLSDAAGILVPPASLGRAGEP